MTDTTGLRIDKWLWFARFFKTRTLATDVVRAGRMRVDGEPVAKPHFAVRPGQVLTFVKDDHVRVIKVIALGVRRGPAKEAQLLYEDLSPPVRDTRMPGPAAGIAASPGATRSAGSGRPTKRDRRALDRFKAPDDD